MNHLHGILNFQDIVPYLCPLSQQQFCMLVKCWMMPVWMGDSPVERMWLSWEWIVGQTVLLCHTMMALLVWRLPVPIDLQHLAAWCVCSVHWYLSPNPEFFSKLVFVEDSSGETVSTVYNSTAPPQVSDSADEFTTYFDQKIPIPEDEKVSTTGPVPPHFFFS